MVPIEPPFGFLALECAALIECLIEFGIEAALQQLGEHCLRGEVDFLHDGWFGCPTFLHCRTTHGDGSYEGIVSSACRMRLMGPWPGAGEALPEELHSTWTPASFTMFWKRAVSAL